jgi:hypothetical protein
MRSLRFLFLLFSCFIHSQSYAANDTPFVQVTPNPFFNEITITVDSKISETLNLTVLNVTGQILLSDSVKVYAGYNDFTYDFSNQAVGVFFLQVSGKYGKTTRKIVKLDNGQKAPTRSDFINVLHYDLSLRIQNVASKTIGGTANIKVVSKVANVQNITLDLLKLPVSAIIINDTAQLFTQIDSTLNIQFTHPKQINDTFEIAISYSGQPVTDAQWGGFYFSGNYAYNMGVGFQSNPHNFGRCWFPCVDDFVDRATYSFHITTDATFKAVCNGLIQPETINQDGSTTWNWELSQPIPTYLASVAVGKYEIIKYDFVGSNRTYPVWIAVVAADTTKAKTSFAKLNQALICFEQKYGAYPFDRVGFVGVPFTSGAMEHAANIAYPNYAINGTTDYETLFAHELSHMWWGNLATTGTAEEMWLNEGWASFNEALFLECVYGKQAYIEDIKTKSTEVLKNAPKNDGAWLPVSGVPHTATYGTHVYKKGALMVHTLRSLMGDAAFFAACKSYLLKYTFKDVSTEELKNEFQHHTPINLSDFFRKWLYTRGHSDIVMSSFNQQEGIFHAEFYELSSQNSFVTASLPFTFEAILSNGTVIKKTLWLQNGQAIFDTVLPNGISISSYSINEDYGVQLAHSTEQKHVTATGNISLTNALFTGTVQQTTGSDSLKVTHHWVGPIEGTIRNQGIKPSTERYWSVWGNLGNSFKTTGVFSYDGRAASFLDAAFITQTEDSLVLLYRPTVNENWAVHTNNTFQPGASKTDKTGRFTVTNLQIGEYTFGMRDANVVGLKEETNRKAGSFQIIPNPTDSEGHIKLVFESKTFIKQVVIRDVQGKVMKQLLLELHTETFPLSIHDIPAGQYIITVVMKNGSVSKQFMKK